MFVSPSRSFAQHPFSNSLCIYFSKSEVRNLAELCKELALCNLRNWWKILKIINIAFHGALHWLLGFIFLISELRDSNLKFVLLFSQEFCKFIVKLLKLFSSFFKSELGEITATWFHSFWHWSQNRFCLIFSIEVIKLDFYPQNPF